MTLAILQSGDLALDRSPFEAGATDQISIRNELGPPADVVLFCVTAKNVLEQALDQLVAAVYPSFALWVAWPKRSSGHVTDLSDQAIRETILAYGLVDNKVCAVDDVWSALRFVWRVDLRAEKDWRAAASFFAR